MTKFAFAVGVAATLAVVFATPSNAKTKDGGQGKGAYCFQGGQNAFIPASAFKPSVRKNLRKGRVVKFNYPGFGPITCRVY